MSSKREKMGRKRQSEKCKNNMKQMVGRREKIQRREWKGGRRNDGRKWNGGRTYKEAKI